MTLKELKKRTTIYESKRYAGLYFVEVKYYGKTYAITTKNYTAYKRAIDPKKADRYLTTKQAWQELYDECARRNKIGKYRKLKSHESTSSTLHSEELA